MSLSKIYDAIDRFNEANIIVIGDVMLDHYICGTVNRFSPEAPVPIVDAKYEYFTLGGAANVANNISKLRCNPKLIGVIGGDNEGEKLIDLINESINISDCYISFDPNRPTTIKSRILANSQQIVRIDRESRESIDKELEDDIISFIRKNALATDIIIISDYNKGVITNKIIETIKEYGMISILDPKMRNDMTLYKGLDIITPNYNEAINMANVYDTCCHDISEIGSIIMDKYTCDSLLITKGSKGMTLFENNGDITKVHTRAKDIFDVVGAGDTVTGVLGLGLAVGLSIKDSAKLANIAAGIVVEKEGTATLSIEELKIGASNYTWKKI